MLHLTEAQKAICKVAVTLDRYLLRRNVPINIIPVQQNDIMEDFKLWVPDPTIQELYKFWHAHNREVRGRWRLDRATPKYRGSYASQIGVTTRNGNLSSASSTKMATSSFPSPASRSTLASIREAISSCSALRFMAKAPLSHL